MHSAAPTPKPSVGAEKASATLRRLVEHLGSSPAFILGRRWGYLAWNDAARAVFSWEPGRDPSDWERGARRLVAKFRADEVAGTGDGRKEMTHPVAGKPPRELGSAARAVLTARRRGHAGEDRATARASVAGAATAAAARTAADQHHRDDDRHDDEGEQEPDARVSHACVHAMRATRDGPRVTRALTTCLAFACARG